MHLSAETNDGLISPKTKVGNWTIVFEYLLQVLSRGWCLPKCIAQCRGTRHQPGPCTRIICSFYSDSRCPGTAACKGGPSGRGKDCRKKFPEKVKLGQKKEKRVKIEFSLTCAWNQARGYAEERPCWGLLMPWKECDLAAAAAKNK